MINLLNLRKLLSFTKVTKGFSIVEVIIAISIISIMVLVIIPTFVKQNETIQLDTLSEELVNTIQLVQTYANSTQTETVVTFNISNSKILELGTRYPAVDNTTIRSINKVIPKFVKAIPNLDINRIVFLPNKNYHQLKLSIQVVHFQYC